MNLSEKDTTRLIKERERLEARIIELDLMIALEIGGEIHLENLLAPGVKVAFKGRLLSEEEKQKLLAICEILFS